MKYQFRYYSIAMLLAWLWNPCNNWSQGKNNQLNFHTGYFHYSNSRNYAGPFNFIEGSYYRKIAPRWKAVVQYTYFPGISKRRHPVLWGQNMSQRNNINYKIEPNIGKLLARYRYQFFDVGTSCNVFSKSGHAIDIVGGVSYAYGKNEYLEKYPIYYIGGISHIGTITWEYKNESYIGGFFGAKYDYCFLKDFVNIGGSIIYKMYSKDVPFLSNYSIHIGVNL